MHLVQVLVKRFYAYLQYRLEIFFKYEYVVWTSMDSSKSIATFTFLYILLNKNLDSQGGL